MSHFQWLRGRKRLPVFMWPAPHYTGSRVNPMRWVDIHYIRENVYDAGPLQPYRADHLTYLKSLADAVMGDPKGERTLMDWHLFSSAYINPLDTLQRQPADAIRRSDGSLTTLSSIWLDEGVRFTREKLDYIFGKLKHFGLELDYYTTQHEWMLTSWAMTEEQLDLLPQDPRWNSAEIGVPNLQGVKYFWQSEANREQLITFNKWCIKQSFKVLDAGVYSVLRKHWPKIKVVDYAKAAVTPPNQGYDVNGWPMAWEYNPWPSACSDLFYMNPGGIYAYPAQAPEEMRPWGNTIWHRFVHSLNTARAISNSNKIFHPEFAGFTQMGFWNPGVDMTKIYKEHVIHAALTNSDALQFWLVREGDGEIIDSILAELDSKISGKREGMYPYAIDWHPTEFRTSLKVNGRLVTRVTDQNFNGQWV